MLIVINFEVFTRVKQVNTNKNQAILKFRTKHKKHLIVIAVGAHKHFHSYQIVTLE